MILNMSFKHMGPSEAVKVYTTEKTERLKKYFDGNISVAWTFSAEKELRLAHCHLVGNHMDYFGEASTDDLHASIELALEKVEKQVKKHKEIVKDHLHKHAHDRDAAAATVLASAEDEEE